LLFGGAAEGRAVESKCLHGRGRRLSVGAVKAAGFAFIGAQRRALTGEADGSGAEFGQEGHEKKRLLDTEFTGEMWSFRGELRFDDQEYEE
jgi:hypothetical protein